MSALAGPPFSRSGCPGVTSPAPVRYRLDPADIASLALDGIAADEYEILAEDLSRQVQAGLAGVAALYPDLPQKTV